MSKKIKICIFDKNTPKDRVIKSNGLAILDNICTDCVVNEKIDGTYELDANFIIDDKGLYKYITEESILKVRLDYGDEIFRIAKITKDIDSIDIFARQITVSEECDLWLTDVRPTNMNGQGCLSHLLELSEGKKEIEVFSDIQNTATAYYQNMNMYEAIHSNNDNSFINRWGNYEVLRRGYRLYINSKVGQDKGLDIRSKKNLTGFEQEIDIDNIVTRIKPIGFDGITIDGYVISPLVDKYARVKTKSIKYEDVKVKKVEEPTPEPEPPTTPEESNPSEPFSETKGTNIPLGCLESNTEGQSSTETDTSTEENEGFDTLELAQAELIRLAELEFSQNNLDKIKADYRINFIDLSQTKEYKNYAHITSCNIGDTVTVIEDTHNVRLKVKVVSRKYDVLDSKVTEITLSNNEIKKTSNTDDILGSIIDKIDKVESDKDDLHDYIDSIINAGIKDSYVIVRKNEIIIGDNPDINLMKNVWRWNKYGLAFSNNGYFGSFSTAITYDGKIVADFIKAGVINADLIRAGSVKGNYIDAKNLIVFNKDNKETLHIDQDGNVIANVTKLSISSKEVVPKEVTEGMILQQVNQAKQELNTQITELDTSFTDYKDFVEGIFRDNIIDDTEKTLLLDKEKKLNQEKEDIDAKYKELSENKYLIEPTKSMLDTDYLNYNNKHTELLNIIHTVIEDSKVESLEIAKIDILFANYSTLFAKLNTTMNTAIEQIAKVRTEEGIAIAKKELEKEIVDLSNQLDNLDTDINTTFKDNILDKVEKESIKKELDKYLLEKEDIINQYDLYVNSAYLSPNLKQELTTKYNEYIAKSTELEKIANSLINKVDLVTSEEKQQLDKAKEGILLNTKSFLDAILRVVEDISINEKKEIAQNLNKEVENINNNINNLDTTMNGAFKDGIIDKIELEGINSVMLEVDKDKESVISIFNFLANNPNLL